MLKLLLIPLFCMAVTLPAPLFAAAGQHQVIIADRRQQSLQLADIVPDLAEQRVVFVGEQHDRYDHHLNQLAVIRHLHEQSPNWVIGLEFFQQAFQRYLDDYIAGRLNENGFLRKTEYFERWGYDYRLYRDIFRYAREQKIPMIALNANQELSRRVAEVGIDGLDPDELAQLPEIDKSDGDYEQRLREIFLQHPEADSKDFENFWETQLLWDESMAGQAAEYLLAHPDQSMIILAGAGHIAHGSGIPRRLQRRLDNARIAILLPADAAGEDMQGADYLLISDPVELAAAAKMGVMLDLQDGVSAREVLPDSAAEHAGMQNDDRILSIAGQPIQSLTDIRLALLDKLPGDAIGVTVQRHSDSGTERLTLQLTLRK